MVWRKGWGNCDDGKNTCDPDSTIMIPSPYYTLINTSKGNDPAVVVVNSALRAFENRDGFPWHLKLTVACQLVGANGMPTEREIETLNRFEDETSAVLQIGKNVLFLARITCRGERIFLYRVRDPKAADEALQQLISAASKPREWEYLMEQDLDWVLAKPELDLLERDPSFQLAE